MSLATLVLTELKKCGVRWIAWLPDSETRTTYDLMVQDTELGLVQVCREDEAIGVCYGLLKGGAQAVVMIQNTGLMNAVDAVRGIPLRMRQPMLLLVGYRGYRSMLESTGVADNAALLTEPLLKAFQLPYFLVNGSEDVGKIGEAYQEAQRSSGPVVVLITREYGRGSE